MGARIDGRRSGDKIYPPITITGARLAGAEHQLLIASAQVKSALMLAGLWASGRTVIREPMRSRDHTERMLKRLGVVIEERDDGALVVTPLEHPWRAGELKVAPDLSSASFFIGAALVTESGKLEVETGANPTRTGFLDVLSRMGARLVRRSVGDVGGEPVERIRVEPSLDVLSGTTIEGELTLRAIDEIPLIAGLAAFARGKTIIKNAEELRVKESDRLKATSAVLSAFGARSTETVDGLIIEGDPERLRAAVAKGEGDHRIAMTAAVMGLGVRGRTRVHGAEHIEVSFPHFADELERLGASVRRH
jgi:3-phosphoshikimate 1-carboxyvinyltransferase